jgi:hypothetical protein
MQGPSSPDQEHVICDVPMSGPVVMLSCELEVMPRLMGKSLAGAGQLECETELGQGVRESLTNGTEMIDVDINISLAGPAPGVLQHGTDSYIMQT